MTTVDIHPGLPTGILDYKAPPSLDPERVKRTFAQFAAIRDDHEISTLAAFEHFDPEKHLNFEEPSKIHSMEDISLPSTHGVSPVAVSEPFKLFTEEAVNIMRDEVLAKEVQDQYTFSSDIAAKQLRGYAPKYCRFIYEAWKHPKTLALISKIAGLDLVPVMDYEIGHINISVPGKVKEHNSGIMIAEDDNKAVVDWHRDSYPFVCVLMMSDMTGMIGGETALRTGTGEIKKVRGPQKGCAAVLQGRYIEHQALRAFGGQERITMVTSFRPRSPFIRDDTILSTVRPVSNLSDLYGQFAEYQLENSEARLRRILKEVRESNKAGRTNVKAIKQYLQFEIEALNRLSNEIVDEDKVVKGVLSDICGLQCGEITTISPST